MKKSMFGYLVLVSIISLFCTFIPNVFSQPENVEVLSYSWYYYSLYDVVVVVGEVQNVGPNIIDSINLQGTVYTTDGEYQAVSYSTVFSQYILPQQKAPFYMYFSSDTSFVGDLSWLSIGIDYVEFQVFGSSQTDYYQYQDLEIISDTHYIDSNNYIVAGNIRNTGDEAAGKLWVVATFYNATGDVIATGFSDYLTPASLPPGQITTFTLAPLNLTPELTTQITDYTLLIQTESPIIPEFPSLLIFPLFMVSTLIAVIFYRKRLLKRINK
ncbi:MAG: FxLYD domain-containing protein [Promethearchaeota archaeon]